MAVFVLVLQGPFSDLPEQSGCHFFATPGDEVQEVDDETVALGS